jgi:hypothetical protein
MLCRRLGIYTGICKTNYGLGGAFLPTDARVYGEENVSHYAQDVWGDKGGVV